MATYKPLAVTINQTALADVNNSKLSQKITTGNWGLALIFGTAVFSDTFLASGTILGWYNSIAGSEGDATIQSFTDDAGRYGITVDTANPVTLKFYTHG